MLPIAVWFPTQHPPACTPSRQLLLVQLRLDDPAIQDRPLLLRRVVAGVGLDCQGRGGCGEGGKR